MKKNLLLGIAAVAAITSASAADMTSTTQPLIEATKIMDRCSAIVGKIAATPVPPGHAGARAAEHHNESVTKANADAAAAGAKSAANDGEKMRNIDPASMAFMKSMRAQRMDLQRCGEEYAKSRKPSEAILKQLFDKFEKEKNKAPNEDDKKIGVAVVAYNEAHDKLVKAVVGLSKDPTYERYMGRVISKEFLGQDK